MDETKGHKDLVRNVNTPQFSLIHLNTLNFLGTQQTYRNLLGEPPQVEMDSQHRSRYKRRQHNS